MGHKFRHHIVKVVVNQRGDSRVDPQMLAKTFRHPSLSTDYVLRYIENKAGSPQAPYVAVSAAVTFGSSRYSNTASIFTEKVFVFPIFCLIL